MALARALHHSAQRVEAPREEGEKYFAPRRQKPPPPGKRPGVLLDPEPQVRSVTWLPRRPSSHRLSWVVATPWTPRLCSSS